MDRSLENLLRFPQTVVNAKSGREMVMENQEMFMEKSWKNMFSSMWEPCNNNTTVTCPHKVYLDCASNVDLSY